jgi:hypothetical protein
MSIVILKVNGASVDITEDLKQNPQLTVKEIMLIKNSKLKEKRGLEENKKKAIEIWNKKKQLEEERRKKKEESDLKKIFEEMKTPSLLLPFENKIKLGNLRKDQKYQIAKKKKNTYTVWNLEGNGLLTVTMPKSVPPPTSVGHKFLKINSTGDKKISFVE